MSKQSRTSRNSRRSPKIRTAAVVGATGLLLAACGGGGGGEAGGEAGGEGTTSAGAGCDKSEAFPNGPIQLLVPWAAGGGTDSVARFIGSELGEKLDTQVNVVNRTGGSGVVGHSAIAQAQPDGSTIGLATVELTMMHHQGLTDLTYDDLTPIGQVNSDPAGVTVADDAPWGNAKELIEAAQENPGEYTASGTGRGGIWHLALAGMLLEAGAEPDAIQWVPSEGAAPALQELVAGGIDVTTSSLVENRTMIEAGKVKPISIMAEERSEQFPDAATLPEQGIDFTMAAWRGIMGPGGMDEDIVAELECNLDEIVHGEEYQEFMEKAGFGIEWKGSEEFAEFVVQEDETKGEIMEAAGLTP
jgi:tripartite-type tricarboxylate transporter receptor subunit TctC